MAYCLLTKQPSLDVTNTDSPLPDFLNLGNHQSLHLSHKPQLTHLWEVLGTQGLGNISEAEAQEVCCETMPSSYNRKATPMDSWILTADTPV